MKIVKKVVLDSKEIAMIKMALYLRGETFRSWCKKCAGKDVKTTSFISNITCTGVVTKKVYDKVLKPLNLPFFKNFKWEEEHVTIKQNIEDVFDEGK